MPLGREYAGQNCTLARALEVVGERWTMLILRDLFFGVRRFAAIKAHLDIPSAALSARLATLVDWGLVERTPYAGTRAEYLLTPRGLELWPILYQLMQWGERHFVDGDDAVRIFSHASCGTELSASGGCATCATTPGPDEIETRPGRAAPRVVRSDAISVALRSPHRLLEPLPRSSP
jgi:DNA-binding HxlR family transcriptional regulator